MDNGCPKCEQLPEFAICLDCQLAQAEWEAIKWQQEIQRIKILRVQVEKLKKEQEHADDYNSN